MAARRPKAVAFDIIETMFSLEPIDAGLQRLGLPAGLHLLLYNMTLRDMFASSIAGAFQPMRTVMEGALDELLARHGRSAASGDKGSVLDMMASLPPAPDATEAVATLRAAGIRPFALSNGAAASTEALLRGAGLLEAMQPVVVTAEIGIAKPQGAIYRHAAARAGVEPGALMLLAAHPWDCLGAKTAGLSAAYVARGRPYTPGMTPPDVVGQELADAAATIAALPA